MKSSNLIANRYFLCLLIISVSPTLNYSQSPEWKNYTAGSSTNVIIEDGEYLWLGGNMLTRFHKESGEMETYDKGFGLPRLRLSSLVIDNDGYLWMGSSFADQRQGLVRTKNGEREIYTRNDLGFVQSRIGAMMVDPTGAVWIGSQAGLGMFDGEQIFQISSSNLPSRRINGMDVDSEGNLWIATDRETYDKHYFHKGGLGKFDGEQWTVYTREDPYGYPPPDRDFEYSDIPGNWLYDVAVDMNDVVWIASQSRFDMTGRNALIAYDGEEWTSYTTDNSDIPCVNWIARIAVDQDNVKWIAADCGLIRYDGNEWILYSEENSGLPTNNITALFVDSSNILWIGTTGPGAGGLVRFDGEEMTVYDTRNSLLSGNTIVSVHVDRDDRVWTGTNHEPLQFEQGLAIYHENEWIPVKVPDDPVYETGSTSFHRLLGLDNDDNAWIFWDKGLARYKNEAFEIVASQNDDISIPFQGIGFPLFVQDCDDNIWFGGSRWDSLATFDGNSLELTIQADPELSEISPLSIGLDGECNILVYGRNGTLKHVDGDWIDYSDEFRSLGSSVIDFALDQNNNLWIGSVMGLVKFDGENWHEFLDMPVERANNLNFDQNNTLWFSYRWNLVKFDGKEFQVYAPENSGLPYSNILSIAIDSQGHVWIGSHLGVAVFREGGISVNVDDPAPVRPSDVTLHQNYPNPFNPITQIPFELSAPGNVRMEVFDILGRRVAVLTDRRYEAGRHEVPWNASEKASGIYIVRMLVETSNGDKKQFNRPVTLVK
jgi:ligand-binding sensor domain-containing protein